MKTMKIMLLAGVAALTIFATPASADCGKIPAAKAAVAAALAKMDGGTITPTIAVDEIAVALSAIGLDDKNKAALAQVAGRLKAGSGPLTADAVKKALRDEFEPRVAEFAKENRCG